MPENIAQVRRVQGNFQNALARPAVPGTRGGASFDGLTGRGPLHIRNGRDCMVALLLLSSALHSPRAAPVGRRSTQPQPPASRDIGLRPAHTAQPPRSAMLAGVHAAPQDNYALLEAGGTREKLQSISNSVAGSCVARPRDCSKAMLAGAVAGLGVVAAGGLGFLAGQSSAPDCYTEAPLASPPVSTRDALLDALPAADRQQVWAVVRYCNGVPSCAVPAIHALLEQLSPEVQQTLQALLPEPAEETAALPAGLPGAAAGLLQPGANWMDHLAEVLGTQISADEAALELDLTALVDATRESQKVSASIVRRRSGANQARLDTIVSLFERDGFNVEQRPFNLTTRTLFGYPYQSIGENLMVTLSGEGTPERTLLLMAHGDVMAPDAGSTGAVDNGAGVAALLMLARRLRAEGLPAGTRVQLLVTDREEDGLHGAKAHVDQCLAEQDCAEVALNLDLLADGDGLTLSGSAEHVHYRDGDSRPRGADVTPVSPAEARMERLLRDAAAGVGLRAHNSTGWTLQSDHIALQRRGVPSIGISLMDAADIAPERARQQAREAYLQAEEAVDWSLYEHYLARTLNATQDAEMDARVGAADDATAAYQALPLSGRERVIHNGSDQPERVNTRRALSAINVLHRAVSAWLATPSAQRDA